MPENNSILRFLDELASDSPAPGGGSVAAANGAMGAALVCMVCRLTIGRKKYAAVEEQAKEILYSAELARKKLGDLMEEDTQAFNEIMEAYRLPKDNPTQVTARQAAIQIALRQATLVPLETARQCTQVISLAERIAAIGNTNAASDAGVAVLCAQAGMHAAALNVETNLVDIQDQDFIHEMQAGMEALLGQFDPIANQLQISIAERLKT